MAGIPCEGCPHTLLELLDTPSSYTGAGGRLLAVKTDETGIQFVDVASAQPFAYFDTMDDAKSYASTYYSGLITEPKLFFVKGTGRFYYIVDGVDHGNEDSFASYYIPSRPGVLKDALLPYYYIGGTGGSGHSINDPIPLSNFMTDILPNLGLFLDTLALHFVDASHDISSLTSTGTVYTNKLIFIFDENISSSISVSWSTDAPVFIDAKELYVFINANQSASLSNVLNGNAVTKKLYVWSKQDVSFSESTVNFPEMSVEVESEGVVSITTSDTGQIVLKNVFVKSGIFLPVSGSANVHDSVTYPVNYASAIKYESPPSVYPYMQAYLDNEVQEFTGENTVFKVVGKRKFILQRSNVNTKEDEVEVYVFKYNVPSFLNECAGLKAVYQLKDARDDSLVDYYAVVMMKEEVIAEQLHNVLYYYDTAADDYYYYLNDGEETVVKLPDLSNAEGILVKVKSNSGSVGNLEVSTQSGTVLATVSPGSEKVVCKTFLDNNISEVGKYVKLKASGGNVLIEKIKISVIKLK